MRDEIAALLTENNSDDVDDFEAPIEKKPYVIMVVGVNGVGKTTTIGKLAYQFKKLVKVFIWVLQILSVRQLSNNWIFGGVG